jgi:hypothetical protein
VHSAGETVFASANHRVKVACPDTLRVLLASMRLAFGRGGR